MNLINLLNLIGIFIPNIISQVIDLDNHNCNVDGGYSWCRTLNKCVNSNYEPCLPITEECVKCLAKHFGENDMCEDGCSISLIQDFQNEAFLGTDIHGCSIGPDILWCDILNTCISSNDECPDVHSSICPLLSCPNFCLNGYKNNEYGCQLCRCNIVDDHCQLEETVCDNYNYICPIITEVTSCSSGGIPGYTTYELSLQIKRGDIYNIYALFGDGSDRMPGYGSNMIIPSSYQEERFNSNFGGSSDELVRINPNLRYDSWLTLGVINGDPEHKVSSIGIDFNQWNDENDLIVTNGAIFLLDPNQRMSISEGGDFIIAQLTIRNDLVKQALFNVQGLLNNGQVWQERYLIYNFHNNHPNIGH